MDIFESNDIEAIKQVIHEKIMQQEADKIDKADKLTQEEIKELEARMLTVVLAQQRARKVIKYYPQLKAQLKKMGSDKDPIDLSDSFLDEEQELLSKALEEIEKLIDRQKKSRTQVKQAQNAAKQKENTIITGLWKDNRLFSPTSDELMEAFSPGHIYYYANINNTKQVSKVLIEDEKELQELKNTSRFLFDLLTSLRAESEPDIYKQVIKDPSKDIVFSVTKVSKSIGFDPRSRGNENSKRSNQSLMIQRGEAMLDMLSQLTNYVGKFDDGSFYYVCIVKYYDSNTDTIKISVPYIGEVLRRLQNKYIGRQEIIEEKRSANKRISRQDNKPFERNDLLKGTCRGIDDTTYEIMWYITTSMIRTGAGDGKKMILTYSKIIKNCPSLQNRLDKIEEQNVSAMTKARNRNNEFRKFSLAWKYLLNKKYSAMTEEWSNISCSPIDKNGILKAPTNTTINDKILIEWNTQKPT